MADDSFITSFRTHEAAFHPTPISTAFSDLLVALAKHAEAERDIEDVDIWDPAFRNWLTDAENCHTAVTTLISSIHDQEPARAEDVALQRMTRFIDTMIGSEEPGTFRCFHKMMPAFQATIRCRGGSGAARRVNHMILTAGLRLDELAGLLSYADPVDEQLPAALALDGPDDSTPDSCAA